MRVPSLPNSPSILVAGSLVVTSTSLISAPVIARAIGPEGRGETAAALAAFVLVPVLLGVGVPLETRRLAATLEGGTCLRTARCYAGLIAAPAAAIAAALYHTVFADFAPGARWIAALGVALAPLTLSWTCDVSVLVAHRRFSGVFAIQVLQPLTFLTSLLALVALGHVSTATVLVANVGATIATFVVAMLLNRHAARSGHVSMRSLVAGGLKFAGSAAAEAGSSRLDQVLALPLLGARQAGLYSVAVAVAMAPFALGQALAASYFTPIATATGTARSHLQAEAARRALVIGTACVPLVGIAAVLGIPIVFGAEFEASIPVTWIALVGAVAATTAYVASMALAAGGRGVRMTVAQVVSLGVGIALLLVLGPLWGAAGAAVASSAAFLVLMALLLTAIRVPRSVLVPQRGDIRGAMARLLHPAIGPAQAEAEASISGADVESPGR